MVLQAKRQRVRLAKESLKTASWAWRARQEGTQSWHSLTAVFLTGRPNRTKGQRRLSRRGGNVT